MAIDNAISQAVVQKVLQEIYTATNLASNKFKKWIEDNSPRLLASCQGDAVMVSLSGIGSVIVAAAGTGFELLYGPRFGWATYLQVGLGVASKGKGASLEVGVVWNIKNPQEYTKWFIEGAATYKIISISGSADPTILFDIVTEGKVRVPAGVKAGLSWGDNQVALLAEYYWLLSGDPRVFPVGLDKQVSAEVDRIKQWGKRNGMKSSQAEELDAEHKKFQSSFKKFQENRNNHDAANECYSSLITMDWIRDDIHAQGVLRSSRGTTGNIPNFKDERNKLMPFVGKPGPK